MGKIIISQEEFAALQAYTQLPERLKQYERGFEGEKDDVFGVRDRLLTVKHVLNGISLGRIVDLGGHSGFFSLSLVDCGMATSSIVYDLDTGALDMGKKMAAALDLQEKVVFKEQAISLDFVRSMDTVDSIICLNLIHHAGVLFDVDIVKSLGWEEYARQWLLSMREKADILILGVGFKAQKPPHWNVSRFERPARFLKIAEQSGWSVIYDANVYDIRKYGISKANGLRTKGMRIRARISYFVRNLLLKLYQRNDFGKTERYHLYIMKR